MRPALSEANKLLLLERTIPAYIPVTSIPQEYRSLIIPAAGVYFRQDDDCDILSQHVKAGIFSLWFHDIFARRNLVLSPFVPHHIYALHSLYEDSLQLRSRPPFVLVEKETNLFNLSAGMHQVPMKAGQKVLSVHINILPNDFQQLATIHPQLLPFINKKTTPIINTNTLYNNAVCNFLMRKMLTCEYSGKTAHRFLYRCALELLINAAQQEAATQPLQVSSLLLAENIHQVFNRITDAPYKTHSIAELCYLFQIKPADLEPGFHQHFAIDIRSYMHMTKMMMVYDRLFNSPFSKEEIAEVAGFSDIAVMMQQVNTYFQSHDVLF